MELVVSVVSVRDVTRVLGILVMAESVIGVMVGFLVVENFLMLTVDVVVLWVGAELVLVVARLVMVWLTVVVVWRILSVLLLEDGLEGETVG